VHLHPVLVQQGDGAALVRKLRTVAGKHHLRRCAGGDFKARQYLFLICSPITLR